MEILEILQDFLCYGHSDCIRMFNDYAYKPMEGLFYLVFFPTVFIIIFIFMLARKMFPRHRGLNILISVSIFAFIILQKMYYWFMILGTMWYFGLIILGFFWLILFSLRGGGGGGAAGRSGSAIDGVFGAVGRRLKVSITHELQDTEKRLEALLRSLEGLINDMKGADSQSDIDNVYRAYVDLLQQIDPHIEKVREMTAVHGLKVGGKFNELLKKYEKLCTEMDSMHTKRVGRSGSHSYSSSGGGRRR